MSEQSHNWSESVALYALGLLAPEEALALEAEAVRTPALRAEIDGAQDLLAQLAEATPVAPPPALRDRILARVERIEAQRKAEGRPPVLHAASRIADYSVWADNPLHTRPADAGPLHVIELDRGAEGATALVWLTHGAPEEVHVDVLEKFLILEGSCEIIVGGTVHPLWPGGYLSIPLHIPHTVRITSTIPCKILLQRIAA